MARQKKRILLVAATELEMPSTHIPEHPGLELHRLVTGVGMVATTYALTRELERRDHDLVLNIGIAGAFCSQFKKGDVVQVTEDQFSELGAEDHNEFLTGEQLGLVSEEEVRFSASYTFQKLPHAKGITVNTVHGNAEHIIAVQKRLSPDVESMEGAAVAYVCQCFSTPWVQTRAISNLVEARNRDAWDIPKALKHLHSTLPKLLTELAPDEA